MAIEWVVNKIDDIPDENIDSFNFCGSIPDKDFDKAMMDSSTEGLTVYPKQEGFYAVSCKCHPERPAEIQQLCKDGDEWCLYGVVQSVPPAPNG